MLGGRGQSGRYQQGSELVAVEAGGAGLVVQSRSADMGRRRPLQETLLLGLAREPRHGTEDVGLALHRSGPRLATIGPMVAVELHLGGEVGDRDVSRVHLDRQSPPFE